MTTFNYKTTSPIPQTYVVPGGVTEVDIEAIGGTGGNGYRGALGGLGGRVVTRLSVTPGEVLWVLVGHAGNQGSPSSNSLGSHAGYSNVTQEVGGGQFGTGRDSGGYGAGSGGGASGVRRGTSATGLDVVMAVQAGGGGGAGAATAADGGDAGEGGSAGSGTSPGAGGAVAATTGGPIGTAPPWPGWGGSTFLSWPPGGGTNFGTGAGGGGDGFEGGDPGTVGSSGGSGGGGGSNWIEPDAVSVSFNGAASSRGAGSVTITPVAAETVTPIECVWLNYDDAAAALSGAVTFEDIDAALSVLTPVTEYILGDQWFVWFRTEFVDIVPDGTDASFSWEQVSLGQGSLAGPGQDSPWSSPFVGDASAGLWTAFMVGTTAALDAGADWSIDIDPAGPTRYSGSTSIPIVDSASPYELTIDSCLFIRSVDDQASVDRVVLGERWYLKFQLGLTGGTEPAILGDVLLSLDPAGRLADADMLWVLIDGDWVPQEHDLDFNVLHEGRIVSDTAVIASGIAATVGVADVDLSFTYDDEVVAP